MEDQKRVDPQQEWAKAVEGAREVLKKAGHKGFQDAAPGGRYIRYAVDAKGMLSTGRRIGRKNPHWNKKRLAIKSLAIDIFRAEFADMERAMRERFAKEGQEWQGAPPEVVATIAANAAARAVNEYRKRIRARNLAKFRRQSESRRINRN